MPTGPYPRGLTVPLLALAFLLAGLAPQTDEELAEELDVMASICALRLHVQDPTGGDAFAHFGAAAIWAECVGRAAASVRDDIDEDLDFLDKPVDKEDRAFLNKHLKNLNRLEKQERRVRFAARDLARPDFDDDRSYEKTVRKSLVAATHLPYLSLGSFLQTWIYVRQGAELRRLGILLEIADAHERLTEAAGAQETKAGQKALLLFALVQPILDAMEERFVALTVPENALLLFGTEQDRASKKLTKAFRGVAHDYGSLLMALAKLADKIGKKVDQALEAAERASVCELTDPADPFNGGGWVRLSVDGGPEVEWPGYSAISILNADRAVVWFGSPPTSEPHIKFELYGRKALKPGTFSVKPRPNDGDAAFQRDFAVGQFRSELFVLHRLEEGTLTVETFKKGKVPHLAGSFDVIAISPDGFSVLLVEGTFQLCGFGVERR